MPGFCGARRPGVPQSKHTWLPTLDGLWPFAFHTESRRHSAAMPWWRRFRPGAAETWDRMWFWDSASVGSKILQWAIQYTFAGALVLTSPGEKPWIHSRHLCYYFVSEVVFSFGDYVFCAATLWHSISQTVPGECVRSISHKLLHDTRRTPIFCMGKKSYFFSFTDLWHSHCSSDSIACDRLYIWVRPELYINVPRTFSL